MAWSWKDIDRITGRKNTGSNISKGVPNWARLAIVTDDRYQHLLRLHVVDAVRREVGYEWTLRRRASGEFTFTPPHPVGDHVTIVFTPGRFRLVSNSPSFQAVVARFTDLYPAPKVEKHPDGNAVATFPLSASADPSAQLDLYLETYGLPPVDGEF